MKPQASPLQIRDFAITSFDFSLVEMEQPEDVNPYFKEYDIEIDFGIQVSQYIQVIIRADVNKTGKKLPGYSLSAEAVCFFQFDDQVQLSEDVKKSLEGFSTIYIALNSLRGLISSMTANAPFGRYILPSVNLNDLVEKKKAEFAIDTKHLNLKSRKKVTKKK